MAMVDCEGISVAWPLWHEPDFYPLPNMLDIANVAAGCKILSKIDLRGTTRSLASGQHQQDAMTTSFGLFENTRMPFDIWNAGNIFRRKIDCVKIWLLYCFAYQDDLEVESKNEREHRQQLWWII
jgi:hypothetical protein